MELLVLADLHPLRAARPEDQQGDADNRLKEHMRCGDDPALEHLAVVGSKHHPGVFEQTRSLQPGIKPAELAVDVQDEFIVFPPSQQGILTLSRRKIYPPVL